jgi:hypothetical protein
MHFQSFSSLPLCHPFLCPLLPSLSDVLSPFSHVSVLSLTSLYFVSSLLHICSLSPVLCHLSHISVPCLPSAVPSLTFLFLVSRSLSPHSPVSQLFSLSPILCHVIYSLSSILLSPSSKALTPINCPTVCQAIMAKLDVRSKELR